MTDKPLFIAVLIMFTISLIMTYSLSAYTVIYYGYNDMHFFVRQLAAVVVGVAIMIVLSWADPDRYFEKLGFLIFVSSLLLLIFMPFMPDSLVKSVLGAKRWIHLGPISIAPTEFFKIGFVFFLAWSFPRKVTHHGKISLKEEIIIIMPYLLILAVAIVTIAVFQKDLGQTAVIALTLLILFIMAGRSLKVFFLFIILGVGAFATLVYIAPHRIARIKSWWSMVQDMILGYLPSGIADILRMDITKEPYQIANSLNAIYHGGFLGQGVGDGQFKLGYLSEVHTDFVLAGVAEELGYLGLVVVTLLILFIVYRLFFIASKLYKWEYYLFTIGIALLIIGAFIINSYGISGLAPIKGIAVPFLSYGGSQILAMSIGIGMVLMISKKRKVGN